MGSWVRPLAAGAIAPNQTKRTRRLTACATLRHLPFTDRAARSARSPRCPQFIVAWLIIVKERWSFAPIGRTGGTLMMGVVTVAAKTLGPHEAFEAIEYVYT